MGKVRAVRTAMRRGRARLMRRHPTESEARLWSALRDRRLGGWKWRRQVSWGPFILDFLNIKARLVIEVDGGQHSERAAYDRRRSALLEGAGLRVLRFWNSDVVENCDGVCLAILAACGGECPDWTGRTPHAADAFSPSGCFSSGADAGAALTLPSPTRCALGEEEGVAYI
jgi:very-short-patch-repair endonuclease